MQKKHLQREENTDTITTIPCAVAIKSSTWQNKECHAKTLKSFKGSINFHSEDPDTMLKLLKPGMHLGMNLCKNSN
jgi:hypothetical protein